MRSQDLAKELVAFSNLEGGMVLLGVEDDGKIAGLIRDDLEEWVMNVCRNKIQAGDYSVLRSRSQCRRQARCCHRPCDPRIRRAHALAQQCQPVLDPRRHPEPGSKPGGTRALVPAARRHEGRPPAGIGHGARGPGSEAAPKLLRRDVRQQEVPDDKDEKAWQSLLINTEVMTEEGATVGGMLLFGRTPNRFLPHAGIDAVAYTGAEQDYDAQERTGLRGPMTPLLNTDGDFVENGIVEQALDFVQRNTRVVVDSRGGRRAEHSVYPRDALREGIVNALIHRDYLLTSTDIELSVYSNRLEIISPGRLPNGVTPDRMRDGIRFYPEPSIEGRDGRLSVSGAYGNGSPAKNRHGHERAQRH